MIKNVHISILLYWINNNDLYDKKVLINQLTLFKFYKANFEALEFQNHSRT